MREIFFRFPDYLLNNKDFMLLIEDKIRTAIDKYLPSVYFNSSIKNKNIRWKVYNKVFKECKRRFYHRI